MKTYYFYSRNDSEMEPISSIRSSTRLKAAKHFAAVKQMPLKTFLSIFSINK